MSEPIRRRRFLALAPAALLGGLAALDPAGAIRRGRHRAPAGRAAGSRGAAWEHPDPRPGVDGSRVLTADELTHHPDLADLFDAIREIPHVADGIRCHCGCADLEGYRSLLSCYEDPGMAQWCDICQGAGRIAVGRTREGQTLDQVRRAIDARYAP